MLQPGSRQPPLPFFCGDLSALRARSVGYPAPDSTTSLRRLPPPEAYNVWRLLSVYLLSVITSLGANGMSSWFGGSIFQARVRVCVAH